MLNKMMNAYAKVFLILTLIVFFGSCSRMYRCECSMNGSTTSVYSTSLKEQKQNVMRGNIISLTELVVEIVG